jgi:hypothetical protein
MALETQHSPQRRSVVGMAWELLGAQRYGLLGWLSPLRDLTDSESLAYAGNSRAAGEHPQPMKPYPVPHLNRLSYQGAASGTLLLSAA